MVIGRLGQLAEDVSQVLVGINPVSAARLDDGVDDRTTFPRVGRANEEPVFLVIRICG